MARCQSIFNLSADNLRLVELCAGVLLGVLSLKSVLLGAFSQTEKPVQTHWLFCLVTPFAITAGFCTAKSMGSHLLPRARCSLARHLQGGKIFAIGEVPVMGDRTAFLFWNVFALCFHKIMYLFYETAVRKWLSF